MSPAEVTVDIQDEPALQLDADGNLRHQHLKFAAPEAIVMHPGPMNPDIEIESAVADGPQSVITEQVTNGVAVRMAVLERVGRLMARR